MTRYAICLVSDANYLFPTTVAARQARAAAKGDDVDVFVFAMGLAEEAVDRYRSVFDRLDLRLVTVGREIYGGAADNAFVDAFFENSKFTFGALGRFFLDQMLPSGYDQLIYLDGDTQIAGSLDPLLRADVPAGHFFAAPDPKAFWINDGSPAAAREQAYMRGLGLQNGHDFSSYFNSGVLRMERSGWNEIGRKAYDYLRSNSHLCICHDQSALNATARERRLPMSLKWNFSTYYRYFHLHRRLTPSIVHFMSHPKPWNGAFSPWGHAEHGVYLAFAQAHPEIAGDMAKFGPLGTVRYHLQQSLKGIEAGLQGQRHATILQNALAYESTVLV